ncbi:Alpha/Beta hydrolase protein [Xylariaceae sp. FL0804]|nr:Alpha/Beta hydrolase protein [Xylariaceae sp. FL0804]
MANALPQEAVALPPSIVFDTVRLATKPEAALECTRVASSGGAKYSKFLVVFLNGLVAPQAGWLPVMAKLIRRLEAAAPPPPQQAGEGGGGDGDDGDGPSRPQMLAYDRYGQGKTVDRDPGDVGKEPGYGHDVSDVVRDLHQLLGQVAEEKEKDDDDDGRRRPIVFVANSIGCAIARLYAQHHPGTVAGLVLLDSMIANTDFVSLFPDPDGDGFECPDAALPLPPGVTPDALRETRARVRRVFHPTARNPEGLDRRELAALLPRADGPRLRGFNDEPPRVLVVGHDPDWFAEESAKGSMATPLAMTRNYLDPAWQLYNRGLTEITTADRAEGPVIAENCGHFIQVDNPALVADLVFDMLDKLAEAL